VGFWRNQIFIQLELGFLGIAKKVETKTLEMNQRVEVAIERFEDTYRQVQVRLL